MAESATNTGNIVGKVDQHMGGNESPVGYKYQYVNVDKNKKLGIIHRGNINSVLYNLLWDIVSHQVDNETARGEMKEINWLLKRFPKDSDRDDDTGVSNDTIHKYVDKARDIIKGMKEPVEEESVYVDNGNITKKPSDTAKKLNEDLDEEIAQSSTARHIRDDLISCGNKTEDIKEYIDFCLNHKYITEGQKKDLLALLAKRDSDNVDESLKDVVDSVKDNLEFRKASVKNLVANMKEPEVVRRCLSKDNKRLVKQALTGKRVSPSEVNEDLGTPTAQSDKLTYKSGYTSLIPSS